MRKRALSILLCVAMVISMTACGSSGKTDPEPSANGDETQQIAVQTDEQTADLPETSEVEPAETEPVEAEPLEPEEILEEKLNSLIFENATFYNESGVTITCEGFEPLDWTQTSSHTLRGSTLRLKVSNQNSDNKKVFFEVQDVVLNDLPYSIFITGSYDYDWIGQPSGAEGEYHIFTDEQSIQSYYELIKNLELLDINISQYSIETVTIKYRVMVGSDSDWEDRTVTLKTSEYQDGDFTKYLGEKVGSLTDSGNGFDLYVKKLNSGVSASLVLTSDSIVEEYPCPRAFLNNEDIGTWYISDFYGIVRGICSGSRDVVYNTSKTDDEIRKEYEIPNGEPIEIKLDFGDGQTFVIYSSK